MCGIKFFATDKMNFKFSHSLFNNTERGGMIRFGGHFGCTRVVTEQCSFRKKKKFDPFSFYREGIFFFFFLLELVFLVLTVSVVR